MTDVNGQQVSNRTAAVVHRGEFYIGVAPRGYLAEVGEEKQVDLLTVDWDSEPVAGVHLTVVFMEHRWYSVRRQAEDGSFYWDWAAEDIPVLTTTVTTDGEGKPWRPFTQESRQLPSAGHRPRRARERDPQQRLLLGVGRRASM